MPAGEQRPDCRGDGAICAGASNRSGLCLHAHSDFGILLAQADRLPDGDRPTLNEPWRSARTIPDLHQNLGQALQQAGRRAEAAAEFEETESQAVFSRHAWPGPLGNRLRTALASWRTLPGTFRAPQTLCACPRPIPYFAVFPVIVAALLLGIAAGLLFPHGVVLFRGGISDGFVKVLRLIITPIVLCDRGGRRRFGRSDLRKAGRTGVKALVYFEGGGEHALALVIGLVAAHLLQPGKEGLNVDPATFNTARHRVHGQDGGES